MGHELSEDDSTAQRDVVLGADARLFGDIGLDAKYGLTPSLTLPATVNTDFAQVEVAEQQINLDRFNLFFPREAAVLPGKRRPVRGWQSQ